MGSRRSGDGRTSSKVRDISDSSHFDDDVVPILSQGYPLLGRPVVGEDDDDGLIWSDEEVTVHSGVPIDVYCTTEIARS